MPACKSCNKPIKGTSKSGLCPTCAAARDVMSRNGRMVQDTMFSNTAEQ